MAIVPRRSFNFLDLINTPTEVADLQPAEKEVPIVVTYVTNYTPPALPEAIRDFEQVPVSGIGIWVTVGVLYAFGYGLVQEGCGQLTHLLEMFTIGTLLHLRGILYRRRQ